MTELNKLVHLLANSNIPFEICLGSYCHRDYYWQICIPRQHDGRRITVVHTRFSGGHDQGLIEMFSEDTGEAYDYLSADKAFSVISKKIHPITDKRYYVCPVCHNGMYLTDTRFRETKCLYCREPLQKELASTEIFERLEDRIKKMSSRAYIMGEEESDE